MKFWAKVKFNEEKNAESLVRAFFKEFNLESSIFIQGRNAKVEIVFEKQPPMEIIEAVCKGNVIDEFNYGQILEEYKKDETKQEKEEKKTSEQTRQIAVKRHNAQKFKIPKLDELAKKSNSYEEFVTLVVDWLEMKKRKKFFKNIIKSAEQVDDITWKNIEENLKKRGIIYKEWDKSWCRKQINNKLRNSKTSITILKFIITIIEYQTYDFSHKEPAEETIEAVSEDNVIDEFNYEKISEECKKDETKQVKEEKKIPEQTKQITRKGIMHKKFKIPELDELAKKSNSYEEFVTLVVDWLDMKERREFFENIIKSAEQADDITWKNIEANLKKKGIVYTGWDKTWCGKRVNNKFENRKTSITILKLIIAITEYQTYDFSHKELAEETSKQIETVKESKTDEEQPKNPMEEKSNSKKRIKMDCMPEIPHFEEILGSVDKTKPIEERVKYVLAAMELRKMKDNEQQMIFEIANTAVRIKNMDLTVVFSETSIPKEEVWFAQMTFSKFINNFVMRYDFERKVKVFDFLKELQNIIILENELKNIT